jgi:tetratricopeptide (TPR) repeat protein
MDRFDSSTRGSRGPAYTMSLAVVVLAVVATAGSALYLSAGGSLFGMSSGTFGIGNGAGAQQGDAALQRAREASWAGRHREAAHAYDTVVALRPDVPELALERARALGWAERYVEAADALGAVPELVSQVEHQVQRARFLWWADRPREADSLLSVIRAEHPHVPEAAELQALIRPSVEPVLDVAARWVAERPEDPTSNLWLARALVREERGTEALAHYRRAMTEPGAVEPEVMLEAAGVALGADSLGLAGQILARYLRDVDPPDHETRLRLARAYSWSGRYQAAEEQYRQVLQQVEGDAAAAIRLELARMLATAGSHATAATEYRRLLRSSPVATATLRGELAEVLMRADLYDEAATEFDALLATGESAELLAELVRARALAERYGAAADAAARLLEIRPNDHALRLERARYLWWDGRLPESDRELSRLLAAAPGHPDAGSLQLQVRIGIEPSVELAATWLEEDDSPENRLHLARAMVRAEDYGPALEHYHVALERDPVLATDSALVREAVDVADAAGAADPAGAVDPAGAADQAAPAGHQDDVIRILERYLAVADRPAPALRLRLARALAWADRPDAAVVYAAYLAERPTHVDARMERARFLTWSETSYHAEARIELERVLAAEPQRAEALKLLADLDRWAGHPELALERYARARALAPELESLDEGVRLAREMRAAELALRDATTVAWAVEMDAFSDTEGFDWVGSGVRREWRLGRNALSLRLSQGWGRGQPLTGAGLGSLGLGAVVGGRMALAPGWAALGELGAISFDDADTFVTWLAGAEYAHAATLGRLRLSRAPAVREAATMAALQAGATLDRLHLEASRETGPWRLATDLQLQRFSAAAGDADRYAGMLVVDRRLGGTGIAVGPMIRAIASPHQAPFLQDWGILYWTPDHYLAPALSVRYGGEIAHGLWLGLRAAPGVAFIDEGQNGAGRYDDDITAILETGVTLGYRRGPWRLEVSGDWGGALPDGYNASGLRIQFSRTGGTP